MRRILIAAAVTAMTATGLAWAAPAATASQCEGVDCVTNPVNAVVCTAGHAKDYKRIGQHMADCFTILH